MRISKRLNKLLSINKTAFALLLLLLNSLLFYKLNFFIPYLTGKERMLDFDAYYQLAEDVRNNINPYSVTHMQTLGPPLVILPYIPFSYLTKNLAGAVFSFINISSGFGVCYLLAKHFFNKQKVIYFLGFTLLFFSSFPGRFSIENGQPNLILTFLITFLLVSRKAKFRGLVLAFLIAIKTFFATLLFAFFKNKKVFRTAILSLGAIGIFSLIFIKREWYLDNLASILFSTLQRTGAFDYYNQSWGTFLTRVGLATFHPLIYLSFIIISIYLIIKHSSLLLAIPLTLLMSPVVWQHYFIILFPVYAILLKDLKLNKSFFLYLLSVIFWWIELPFLHKEKFTALESILASHYFLSAMLLIVFISLRLERNKASLINYRK